MRHIPVMQLAAVFAVALLAADPGTHEVVAAPVVEPVSVAARTAVSVNPIALRLGYFSLEFERAVAADLTFFIEPSVIRLRGTDTLANLRGGRLAGGARWYLVGAAMNGWFVAPELFVNALALEGQGVQQSRFGFGGGVVVGGSWIVWKHVYASIGAGFLSQYRGYALSGDPIRRVATGPTLRLNLGGAF